MEGTKNCLMSSFTSLRVFHFIIILSILFTELKEFKEGASKT